MYPVQLTRKNEMKTKTSNKSNIQRMYNITLLTLMSKVIKVSFMTNGTEIKLPSFIDKSSLQTVTILCLNVLWTFIFHTKSKYRQKTRCTIFI